MSKSPLRVLIVDDSLTVRRFLASLIAEAPDMTVIGEARDGEEALKLAARLQPDIISMDIQMPRLDGLAATQRLMQENPVPIVIVSGRLVRHREEETDLVFLALQAGALAVLETPPNHGHPDFPAQRDHFLNTLRAMAGVSVVRRWGQTGPLLPQIKGEPSPEHTLDIQLQVIVMGASAGGPVALYQILGALPGDFSVPIAIVQHMADGFVEGMVRWLNSGTPLHVMQAQQGQIVQAGEVVVAGSGVHLTLRRAGNGVRVALQEEGDSPYQPSVDVLFASVAEVFGSQALGVLLTGMGTDGAQGLLTMRQRGARTIVQDADSCLVYGMPGAAVSLGAAEQVVPLRHIAASILDMVRVVPSS